MSMTWITLLVLGLLVVYLFGDKLVLALRKLFVNGRKNESSSTPETSHHSVDTVEPLPLDYNAIAQRVIEEAGLHNIPVGDTIDVKRVHVVLKSIAKFLQVVSTITPNRTDDKIVTVINHLLLALDNNPELLEFIVLLIYKYLGLLKKKQ